VAVLAAPRIIAGTITTPLLVSIANVVGIFSGMIAADLSLGLGHDSFLYGARLYWHSFDLFYSIAKGVVFGFIIPLIAVHMGFRTRGGAEGVGRATTAAVVFMIISLLLLDATFPSLFLN
jgi:phospholipid/cholesterol/gamma-HCH transport system permease protein